MYPICSSCRECGLYMVRDADLCPQCGSTDPFGRNRRKWMMVLLVLVCVVMIELAIVSGFASF